MKKFMIIVVVIFALIQLVPVEMTNPPVDQAKALNVPQDIAPMLKRACNDCHSNETLWPWYSSIAPISWFVADHVNDGREAFNISDFKDTVPSKKAARLRRAMQTTINGMMPLPSYIYNHKEADLTKEERLTLADWLEKVLVEFDSYDVEYKSDKDFKFTAKIRGNKAVIAIEGRNDTEVEYVRTPVGIKYTGEDILFLIKGENEAYISVGDDVYNNCKKIK